MGDGPRSPVLEGILDLGQGAFTSRGRGLTIREEQMLSDIFKQSLVYADIRIAQTPLGAQGRPYTLGNTIRIPPRSNFNDRTLVHECMHVWQYQNRGTSYISNSIWHQVTDPAAYEVTIVPNQPLSRYTAEHQAVIVEAYYVDQQIGPTAPATQLTYNPATTVNPPVGWSLLPDVIRILREIRSARPMTAAARYNERLGPQPNPFNIGPTNNDREAPPIVPILRWDF